MKIRAFAAVAALIALPALAAPLRFDDVTSIVYPSAKATFAGMHANTYIPDALLAETIGEFIGIPGNEAPVLFGHYAMVDGCRPQSCDEKAAVIVDVRSRAIAAVALRNYQCRNVVLEDSDLAAMASVSSKRPTVRCNSQPLLDVYIVRRSIENEALRSEQQQLSRLRKWGDLVGHEGEQVQVVVRDKSK
jgi:hypothetical protein